MKFMDWCLFSGAGTISNAEVSCPRTPNLLGWRSRGGFGKEGWRVFPAHELPTFMADTVRKIGKVFFEKGVGAFFCRKPPTSLADVAETGYVVGRGLAPAVFPTSAEISIVLFSITNFIKLVNRMVDKKLQI